MYEGLNPKETKLSSQLYGASLYKAFQYLPFIISQYDLNTVEET